MSNKRTAAADDGTIGSGLADDVDTIKQAVAVEVGSLSTENDLTRDCIDYQLAAGIEEGL